MSSQFTNDPLNDWDYNKYDNNSNGSGGLGVLILIVIGIALYFFTKG